MTRAAIDKAYDPAQVEPEWVQRWLDSGVFAPQRREGDASPPYVVLLPPPNVTGVLHMGHVLANTLQDVFIRWARMSGRETLWWPGTDHAGIATQKVVEKNLRQEGIDPAALGREAFLQRCWEWKEKSHTHIVQQMQRLGWSLDWSREYFTLDAHMSAAVVEVFIRLYRKGLIYKGAYIINWCPNCKTAISDEEVEHVEQQGKIWTLRYPFTDGDGFVRVATTRPETMLGDVAVAIHPDDPRAAALAQRKLRLPLVGREIPIVLDTYVDPAFGTGMVKITPAHDPNDFHVGKRHGLEAPIVIDPDGRMNAAAGAFQGLDRFKARAAVLAQLEAEGAIDKVEPHTLSIGRHDRCETIIEPYLSQQWFVKMQPLAAPALQAVEDGRITFYPERWRNVYLHWMRTIQDWCISRQLWWGHRIPVWYCDDGHETVAHAAPAACEHCGKTALRQDESVLDTWFSSWLCPFSPMGWPEQTADLARFHPTTLLVTGYEIIFFWVARMIMASLEFMGEVPFKQVLLNGIVRDAKGRKLSKSLGNSPDPLDLIAHHGADAVRFSTVMLSPPGQDTFFDAKNVETGQHFANKVWNAARLVLTNAEQRGFVGELALDDAVPAAAADGQKPGSAFDDALATLWRDTFERPLPAGLGAGLRLEDRWILHRYTDAVASMQRDLESLRANDAANGIYHFFWDEYCAWYLEAIKPRMQGDDRATARSAHAVALVLLASASKLLAPLMPFLAEELWSRIPGTRGLVSASRFPRELADLRDARSLDAYALVTELAGAIRTVRSERNVPPGKKAQALVQKDTAAAVGWTTEQGALLELHAKLASLETTSERPQEAVSVLVRGLQLFLPLGGLVDLDAERERLQRELDKAERDLGALDAKLANPGFVDKAPAALVEGERARRQDLAARRDRLRQDVAALLGRGS